MRELAKYELNALVSDEVASYENGVSLFVPLTSDQPVIMYTSISSGIPSMHYLGVDIKRKYAGGLYVYSPKKPFDISEHEFSDNDISLLKLKKRALYLSIELGSERDKTISVIDKPDAIAIAKALGVTGGDLLL